jgi:hypothetical protein
MIEIDGKIISLDIFTKKFACDISRCHGICCVEGNAGAPLEEGEDEILEQEFHSYSPFMTPEGIAAIEQQGFAVVDEDGDLTTPLIGGAECAYSIIENGITMCAIEKAWFGGLTEFRKPISCHLYPIRVTKFRNGTLGLNYHRWDVCAPAIELGNARGIPIYRSLKEPIIRAFGDDFYEAMEEAKKYITTEM